MSQHTQLLADIKASEIFEQTRICKGVQDGF